LPRPSDRLRDHVARRDAGRLERSETICSLLKSQHFIASRFSMIDQESQSATMWNKQNPERCH
jgi:hypothetical protein